MNDVLMQQFIQLISTNTGLHIREQDREALSKKIYARMKLLKFSVPEQYYQLLKTENDQSNSPLASLREFEWRELILLLTTGETYFFRDRGLFTLLKNRILPELITHKQQVGCAKGEAKPSLRLWSAGCSTGEEPYSLAILVKELIPDWSKWNILILGTDINPESIEKAKLGIYYPWSFRMVEAELQRRYFYQCQACWKVDEQIRTMVTFRSGNLIKEHFPTSTSDIQSMDLILCRNVFIYFDFNTISVVLEKFYNTLRAGGYLIAGHTELHGQNLGHLQAKVFPESVVYQRSQTGSREQRAGTSWGVPSEEGRIVHKVALYSPTNQLRETTSAMDVHSHLLPSAADSPVPPIPKGNPKSPLLPAPKVLSQAEAFFHKGAYAIAIKEAEQVIKHHPDHFEAYYLMAQAFANLGECEKAIHCCQQALQIDSLSVDLYYLLAHIAEEQGDIEKAKDLLKKIIYIAPSSIAAYLELGELYESEGDTTRARKMLKAANELLKELPPDANVEYQGGMIAGELIVQINKLLKNYT